MEYLVTMTTRVPDGTTEGAVAVVKAREAARSAELAHHGHLLRLWRPPLGPGEWRTLGLFAADNGATWKRSSRPCRCGSGVPTRSLRSPSTRTTQARADAHPMRWNTSSP